LRSIVSLAIIICVLSGCTTLRTVELPQSTVQQRIVSEDLIIPGDKVRIVTIDGKQHDFKVATVDGEYIKGNEIEIPVKDISIVEKRRISIGKTLLLSGAAFLLLVMSQF